MTEPTKENIGVAKRLRSELLSGWERIDEILYSEFRQLNKNVNQHEVAYKVTLVDKLYNCNLKMDAEDVAGLITNAKIDDELRTGDPINLVEKIAGLSVRKVGKRRRANLGPVFASKYCHFHEPNRFAIYDRFALRALEELLERRIRGYHQFKSGIDDLRLRMGLPLTYKDIDVYLWIYGQWLDHWIGKTIRWIERAEKSHRELFWKLPPSSSSE